MPSSASLAALLALAVPAIPQEPPAGDGPRGTSQAAPGESRFDEVGRAGVRDGLTTAVRGLARNDVVEITALASGRTVVAMVAEGSTSDAELAVLSSSTAAALNLSGDMLVRVRRAVASPQEIVALRGGEVLPRADTPQALLVALRKLVPPPPVATPMPPRAADRTRRVVPKARPTPVAATPAQPPATPIAVPAKPPKPKPAPSATGNRYVVQVGTFSTADRAQAVARRVGGSVSPAGKLYRVRIGPLSDRAAAESARARSGAADAAIIRID